MDALRELRGELAATGITLTIARAKGMIRSVFDETSFTAEIGPGNFFPTVRTGVHAYQERAES